MNPRYVSIVIPVSEQRSDSLRVSRYLEYIIQDSVSTKANASLRSVMSHLFGVTFAMILATAYSHIPGQGHKD